MKMKWQIKRSLRASHHKASDEDLTTLSECNGYFSVAADYLTVVRQWILWSVTETFL